MIRVGPNILVIGDSTSQRGKWQTTVEAALPQLVEVGTRTSTQGYNWDALTSYVRDDIAIYSGIMWLAQAPSLGVTPGVGVAEWSDIYDGAWVAMNPYQYNCIVSHDDGLYQNRLEGNTNEPGIAGSQWAPYSIRHEAASGRSAVWFVDDAASRLSGGVANYTTTYDIDADIVVIMLGINDLLNAEATVDSLAALDELRRGFLLSAGAVLLCTVPPPNPNAAVWVGLPVTRADYETARAALNAGIYAMEDRVVALESILALESQYADAYHPSDAGYAIIGTELACEIARYALEL